MMWRSLAGKFVIAIIALYCALSMSGCSTEKLQMQTEEAIVQFHERFNAEDYRAIYQDAHQALKDAQTLEETVAVLRESKEKYGAFQAIKDKRISVLRGDPLQVRIAYLSQFEKGEVTEIFSYAEDDDGVMRLSYYNVIQGPVDIHADNPERDQ